MGFAHSAGDQHARRSAASTPAAATNGALAHTEGAQASGAIRWLERLPRPSPWTFSLAFSAVLIAWLVAAVATPRFSLALIDSGETYAERRLVLGAFLPVVITLLGFARAAAKPRLRWLALALIVHAFGSILFGDSLIRSHDDFNVATSLYGFVLTRALMLALAAVGLALFRPPLLTVPLAAAIFGCFLLLAAELVLFADRLPSLATFERLPPEPVTGITPGFTFLYWVLTLPFALLAWIAAWRTARRHRTWEIDAWIVVVALLLAGFALHGLFRPSYFGLGTKFTTANVLMTTNVVVIITGSTFTLHTIAARTAADRDALAVETRRLADLARLRADFTTMVAHELTQPLLAIRRTAEVLQLGELSTSQERAVASITAQANALFAMVDDVRASGVTDSEDFSLEIEPVAVERLIGQARGFYETLPGSHPIEFIQNVDGEIWADSTRIEQVLRNLLTNAHRYTPPGTAIAVRVIPFGAHTARFEVEDNGPGIGADQLERVFEKYGRGTTDEPGLGVGLYLSRRILRDCGSDLQYRDGTGGGACFWFDLPRVSG